MKAVGSAARTLCVLICFGIRLAGCGRKTTVIKATSGAENALFTDDGRLFMTGQDNIFEVTKDDTGRYAIPLCTQAHAN